MNVYFMRRTGGGNPNEKERERSRLREEKRTQDAEYQK